MGTMGKTDIKSQSNMTVKEMRDAFNLGSLVSIKHKSVFSVILAPIKRFTTKHIFVDLVATFLENNILTGDVVTLNVLRPDYEYVIFGKIESISADSLKEVKIIIESVNKYINVRKEKRYLANFAASIRGGGGEEQFCIIKNVSIIGLSLISKQEFLRGNVVQVKFSSNIDDVKTVVFEGIIKRVNHCIEFKEYGIEITNIDANSKVELEKLLSMLEKDEHSVLHRNKD